MEGLLWEYLWLKPTEVHMIFLKYVTSQQELKKKRKTPVWLFIVYWYKFKESWIFAV
jgi:hypothetical protein